MDYEAVEMEVAEDYKCRVCTISSECVTYFNIYEKRIINAVIVKDALKLITNLMVRIYTKNYLVKEKSNPFKCVRAV